MHDKNSRGSGGKLHIAMIGHKRVPSREGGVEIVVWELARHLLPDGYDVDCYNRSGYHVNRRSYERIAGRPGVYDEGVRIITVPTPEDRRLNAFVYSFFATLKAIFCHYDVIHYHAEGPCLMLWLPKLLGIRTVATIHGLDWQRSKWGNFASRMLRKGEAIAAKDADELIVLSRNMQQYFEKEYGRKPVYIPNGIDRPTHRKIDLIGKGWGLTKDGYIMTLSRIVPEKGIHYLIEAFRQVQTDKKLVIVGASGSTDEYLAELQEMAKEDSRIIFTGFKEGQYKEEFLSNAYLFLLPSDVEGMSISLLEAMSYGNCCVVSDIEENTEVVEDRAVVFQKGDVEDLRDKLQDLFDHPEKVDAYRSTAADYICTKYSWEATTRATEAVYDDVTGRRSTYLRRATPEDARILFDWRNDPVVRANSFHHETIEYEQHEQWYAKLLQDPSRVQYILMVKNSAGSKSGEVLPCTLDQSRGDMKGYIPAGQIRLNIEDGEAEIGYSIDTAFRGRGLGSRIIALAEEKIREEGLPIRTLVARVLPDNTASHKVFRGNGFKVSEETTEYTEYRKEMG